MNWKKTAQSYGFSLALSLYTNAVVLALWNWFVVPGLHAPEVGYWQIYGLTLLLSLLLPIGVAGGAHELTMVSMLLEALLPEEKRPLIEKAMQEQEKQSSYAAVYALVTKFGGNTVALFVGWAVHTFLV
jgi:hypothetical protein